ncbi:MAG TPA: SH3 domain-containing protein [bacterium]|nr:SH3 domain-containing protein [bacterium]
MKAAGWMLAVVMVMAAPMLALADEVVLTDGSMLTGQVQVDGDTVLVTNAAGTFAIARAQVSTVRSAAVPATGGYQVVNSAPGYQVVNAPAYTAQNPYAPYANAQYPYGYGVNAPAAWSAVPAGNYLTPYALPAYQAPVTTQQVSTPYDQLLQVTGAAAPIRRGPGTQYAVILSVHRDDVLYRVGHTDGWYNVITRNGQQGWINAGAVAEMGSGPDLTPYQWDFRIDPADLVVVAPTLNVRSGPGLNHPLIDKLYHGDAVKTIAREGQWTRVQYLDPVMHTGWVHSSYVTDLYRYVKLLIIQAKYDEAVALGDAALPALQELANHEDWRIRANAAMVRDKIVANRAMVPGMASFNYERTATGR